ncbi:hypothetical protein GTN31_07200 [Macrococcoides canis]|uniref:SMI1/KNR4 family protein n=1 Tax=Macrococcoides canis TaxID=1855823 RepID=UPI0013E9862D|nr:SMI1/KNR4 family protein [Macrococcus canis]QIH76145.1 hypothetical protein GTN31_07200 [Macrococcus canis]
MDYENLKNKLEVRGNKLTESDIDLFESWRGYKLPKDFVEFTLKYPGAYVEGSFDAEDRLGASINQFLKFEKNEYYSIYIDSLYEFSDFGPYVLFACDAGGNYLAFDYSTDELNPSVVFIDHEELGIIEFPDGKSENDFTEEELDKMMSSEKLEDYPWAIHNIDDSFTKLLENSKFNVINYQYFNPEFAVSEEDLKLFEKYFDFKLTKLLKNFLFKYAGIKFVKTSFCFNDTLLRIHKIYALNKKESNNIYSIYEKKGGKDKFNNLIPIILVGYNDDIRDISVVALNVENEKSPQILVIPEEMFHLSDRIIKDKLIFVTDDIESFFSELDDVLGDILQ